MILTPIQRAAFVSVHKLKRGLLLQEFPELLEDQQALDDTLEGISYVPDMIAGYIRDAREDEAYVAALSQIIREMSDRKARLEDRAKRRREIAQHLMEAVDMRKLEMPEFTASIIPVRQSVVIDDETMLPDNLVKIVRQPIKADIKEALERAPVPGAHLSNGGTSILIRTK